MKTVKKPETLVKGNKDRFYSVGDRPQYHKTELKWAVCRGDRRLKGRMNERMGT